MNDHLIGVDDHWIDKMAALYRCEGWFLVMTFEQFLRIAARFQGIPDESEVNDALRYSLP